MFPPPADGKVLVVGAGPAGLCLAAELLRRGVEVDLVDRADAPSGLSKALAIWPRTVELLRRLGFSASVEEWALPQAALRYYSAGRPVGEIGFTGDQLRPLAFPQPAVEHLLREAVTRFGGIVHWGTELQALTRDSGGVTVRLAREGEVAERRYAYVVGADGAGSRVRTELGVPFDGATHELGFVVADIDLDTTLQPDVTHYFCSTKGILVTCGLPDGRWRVFTSGPPGLRREDVGLELVQQLVDERGPGGLQLRNPHWISVFSVHARHAGQVRAGRVFLVGDAAHIHSPAGGQGLNTGVGDAHNLGWKLALVAAGHADPRLLDTYAEERGQVARAVIRQAEIQTRIWLLRRGFQVRARDAALRLASALRLFHRAYVPWLAGLRTVYGTAMPGSVAFGAARPGGLVPDRAVWDERRHRRLPLRAALDDLRYTVLLAIPGQADVATARLLRTVRETYGELVDIRVLRAATNVLSGELPRGSGSERARRSRILLVRPDGHIDACVPLARAQRIADRLRHLIRPAAPRRDPVAAGGPPSWADT
ncbi:FAD-dependent monooxygenase [Actinoplanes sp. TFC3]|uniref:FAD-dependent monooxygenase n=1 Tax=Actinoplanes sp. TFC3 TaxID=1710355 RepID=UPI000ADFC06A|nr:FAD-dependent monooxygenase [Actinoplanes sp. TFC3]